ncbi:MAG TPA: DUF2279 domain-containing protein [Gemmatimonadaceae bacterium]
MQIKKLYITKGLFALTICAGASTQVASAQDSSGTELPSALLITSGIERQPQRNPVVVLPNPSCPLTANQVNAVRAGVGSAFIGGNAYLYHYFKKAWWSGERAPHFFFHADWDQWFRDQDKFGHLLGGYHLARIGYASLREACVSDKKAIFWSAAYAAAFQLQIEIFDGMYKKYGFSYADMIANTAGQALAVMQELNPRTRAIKPTFSYHKTRALMNTENGTIQSELRPSLDYSGQTYWFSADMDRLLPDAAKPYWPSFIRVSVGHSITDWIDPNPPGATQRARRKILLSLDFDPEKLPGNFPLWRTVKHTLSYYHFPAPALELTPKLHVSPWYR